MKKIVGIVLFFLLLLFLGFYYGLASKRKEEIKLDRIKELTEQSLKSSGYSDEKKAREVRKEICELTARDEKEREKAVTTIKLFLGKTDILVEYSCSDAFYNTTDEKLVTAKTETYTVGKNVFLVNLETNHVVGADFKEFETSDKTYSENELETLALNFLSEKKMAIGDIDLNKMVLEKGQKGDNYFFTWKGEKVKVTLDPPAVTCSKDIDKNIEGIYYQADGTPCYKTYESIRQPVIQIAFNKHGQILNYSNDLEGDVGREMLF